MKLWIARDENGLLGLHKKKPYRYSGLYGTEVFTGGVIVCYLDSDEFPEITFENSPQEVELKLIEKMKEITMQVPDDKELVWDEDLEAYKLVDADDIEQENILRDFETDINNLYAKYHDRLRGKFSIKANICFTAYYDGNRYKTQHWVDKTCAIDIISGEKNWHD